MKTFMSMTKVKYMNKSNKMNVKLKIGLKSFITVISILLIVLITVGVLTYVIPAGRYTIYTTDESKCKASDTAVVLEPQENFSNTTHLLYIVYVDKTQETLTYSDMNQPTSGQEVDFSFKHYNRISGTPKLKAMYLKLKYYLIFAFIIIPLIDKFCKCITYLF